MIKGSELLRPQHFQEMKTGRKGRAFPLCAATEPQILSRFALNADEDVRPQHSRPCSQHCVALLRNRITRKTSLGNSKNCPEKNWLTNSRFSFMIALTLERR